ncbi:MAG: glycoside hydrolase family 88 protein [Tannerella sp.]|jgi:rhamnogalacturonyl hydrolase YesR|nr:glycoside hydrolase family 88 protein [Tannerella sp.]
MKKIYKSTYIGLLLLGLVSCNQPSEQSDKIVNDSNTPLHLLTPDYHTPYQEWKTEDIKSCLDKVLGYLESTTPTRTIDKESGEEITDYTQINQHAQLDRGAFRLASYEWGVTYSGMMEAAKATGDARYMAYVEDRFRFLAEMVPYFTRLLNEHDVIDAQMRQILRPGALDDAGAVCAAMIKLNRIKPEMDFSTMIDNYMDFIMNKEHRLSDGTFARMRPQANTMWLDDMYMAIPSIAQMGAYTGDTKYFDEAVRQIFLFSERMFVEEKGLYMHGWVEGEEDHPAFHWGRANGWALLTMTEVLDVLPEDYPGRDRVMAQYKAHVKGITRLQSGEGFWHQLLDRNDSYLETSATAIFTYCIARGINKGWLDAISYGPVAQLGWSAVATKVNDEGQVEGTCVGTGMAFDPAFYYYRPVNVYAAHGYGPVLLAGAEMINLLNQFFPKMNDSAIQYYSVKQNTTRPIFGIAE